MKNPNDFYDLLTKAAKILKGEASKHQKRTLETRSRDYLYNRFMAGWPIMNQKGVAKQ